jgi:hypothetical protein
MHLHQRVSTLHLQEAKVHPAPLKKFSGFQFMDLLAKYLTIVKPDTDPKTDKYLPSSILRQLKEQPSFDTDMGPVDSKWILAAIKLLFDTPRSKFLPTVSTNSHTSLYSAAVPYFLYAFKSQFGVKYSAWDLEEGPVYSTIGTNAGGILLGSGLKNYVEMQHKYLESFKKPEPPPGWAPDWWLERYGTEVLFEGDLESSWLPSWRPMEIDLKEIRKDFLTHGKTGISIGETIYGKGRYTCHPILADVLTDTFYRHMFTQTWVFTPRVRNQHMIMSLTDIDEMPDPIEGITLTVDKTSEKETEGSPFDF